jgi:hypothetical protein
MMQTNLRIVGASIFGAFVPRLESFPENFFFMPESGGFLPYYQQKTPEQKDETASAKRENAMSSALFALEKSADAVAKSVAAFFGMNFLYGLTLPAKPLIISQTSPLC